MASGFFSLRLCVSAPPRWVVHAADGVSLIGPPLTCESLRPPIQPLPFLLFFRGVLFLDRMGLVFLGMAAVSILTHLSPLYPWPVLGHFGPLSANGAGNQFLSLIGSKKIPFKNARHVFTPGLDWLFLSGVLFFASLRRRAGLTPQEGLRLLADWLFKHGA